MSEHVAAIRSQDLRQPILVGRERELALLSECLSALRAGVGRFVLVGGDPGIGKTYLIEAVLRQARAGGAFTLVGHCYDRASTPPYGPWIDLFVRYPHTSEAPPLPPAFAVRGEVGAVPSQLALFAQVQDFFARLVAWQPVLVVIEDLHWADPASVELLRFLAQSIPTLPVMIVGTYRQAEPQPTADLLPILTHATRPVRLDLRPLGARDVRSLVDAGYRLPNDDAQRLTGYLLERSEGNPLFLAELLRTLEEEALLQPAAGGHRLGEPVEVSVPVLLQQVIAARVRRLGYDALTLLTWAAIIGQEIPLDLWANVAGTDDETLLEVTEAAVAARVLQATPDGERVRFAHALIREALYEAVLPPRRRRMHQRIAEAVARLPLPDPDVVAFHFRQAGDERAAEWLLRAGERSLAAYANKTAVARFEEALPLLERDPALAATRADVLLILARLLRLEATDPMQCVRYAEAAMDLATELGDDALAAIARFRMGTNLCLAIRSREGLAAMRAASDMLDSLPADTTDRLVRLDPRSAKPWQRQAEYALRSAIVGRFSEAEPQALAAREVVLRRHDGNYNASNALTHVYSAQGRVADALAIFAECQPMCIDVEDYYNATLSVVYELARVVIPFCADQMTVREEVAERGLVWNRQITGPFAGLPPCAVVHGLLFLDGRWDEIAPGAFGSYGLQQEYAWVRGRIALARGETREAWRIMRPFLPESPASEPGDTWFLGATAGQRLAVAVALAEDDLPTACAWLEAHDRWLDWAGAALGHAESATLWARYHRIASDTDLARASVERALAFATEPRQPLVMLAAQRLLGELDTDAGCYDDAHQHLQTALALADACHAPYERALTLVARVEALRLAGESAQARADLDAALALCAPLRAAPLLACIAELATRWPASPAASAPPAGLTTREVEVLRLVVDGLTDREIAQQLSIGSRTVQTHVTSILAKLSVNSRTAAATYAVRHGIV